MSTPPPPPSRAVKATGDGHSALPYLGHGGPHPIFQPKLFGPFAPPHRSRAGPGVRWPSGSPRLHPFRATETWGTNLELGSRFQSGKQQTNTEEMPRKRREEGQLLLSGGA